MEPSVLPSPCLVVLVGPVASGKSTWAAQWFAPGAVVSSDALRAVVGEGEHDLAASADAFAVLDDVVARRLKRRLTTVIDSLGTDAAQRRRWRELADTAGVPCVAVVFDTPAAECRRRNAARDVSVRADVVANQLRRWPAALEEVRAEPWADVLEPDPVALVPAALVPAALAPRRARTASAAAAAPSPAERPAGLRWGLHLGQWHWPGGSAELATHLRRIAQEAEAAGVHQITVMDHLRQIPQVGPAWDDLPEAYTVLSWLAACTERVRLGALVTPAFLRPIGLLAQQVATLDVLSGGRACCGLGVGWFEQECRALGIPFPTLKERYAHLEDALQALPLLWGKGTPAFEGRTVSMPEAMCYPRPLQPKVPILVGGGGERRTLWLVARYADACNLFGEPDEVARKVAVLRRRCEDVGRDPAEIDVTHLSTVLIGHDRADVAELIDRTKPPRRSAERYAREVNAGTVGDHAARAERMHEAGVTTMIVAVVGTELGALDRLAALVTRTT